MDAKVRELDEELAVKNEELEAALFENRKRGEEMKQWQFAVAEMEAVHSEIRTLEQQVSLNSHFLLTTTSIGTINIGYFV
ncbi:unnamed protein product [Gongylonema pulchrum]|uniref:NUDE_C domain-containing protein n=1 Tax=Gongylonema pulchrum TaxID=637853 RepID=A0A183DIN0_9BILA|nr:unnamed protein product [Gongylonema pulchrum]